MKKVGSSESRSKKPKTSPTPTSESRQSLFEGLLGTELAVGHAPTAEELDLSASRRLRVFQANLLSLLSHELRTPVLGVLNAVTLLEQELAGGSAPVAMGLEMARRNAERLRATVHDLLDLATIESGAFHARLREIDLETFLKKSGSLKQEGGSSPVLADPQKLRRACELLKGELQRAGEGEETHVSVDAIGPGVLQWKALLKPEAQTAFLARWKDAEAARLGGLLSTGSAFGVALADEQVFLARGDREGMGTAMALVQELFAVQDASVQVGATSAGLEVRAQFPTQTTRERLLKVLENRIERAEGERDGLGVVSVLRLRFQEKSDARTPSEEDLRATLLRSTDAVYRLERAGEYAVILEDCRPAGIEVLLGRLREKNAFKFASGVAHFPGDSADPSVLLTIAEQRLNGNS